MTRLRVELPGREPFVLEDGRLARAREEAARHADLPPVRLVYAAAHVVLKESYAGAPRGADPAEHVDWTATLGLRTRLDRLGFGVAEAMDTAQRFEIGWPLARRLIESCGRLGLAHGFVAGAGVDHLERVRSKADLIEGVVHQARITQDAGGLPIVLPMPWLCEVGASEEDYLEVYAGIFERLGGPLFVHWLGEMFLPALRGYFPGTSFERVMALAPDKVRGAKLSLLDDALELRLRRELLARDQILLTGDDLHFARLLRGGDPANDCPAPAPERTTRIGAREVALGDFSHGLLGVFDAVAAPAGLALRLLAAGESARAMELLEPCEALGRKLFEAPTHLYKSGLAHLSWLNGLQQNPMLVNRLERERDLAHLIEVARLASAAGCLEDAPLAAARLRELSTGSGG